MAVKQNNRFSPLIKENLPNTEIYCIIQKSSVGKWQNLLCFIYDVKLVLLFMNLLSYRGGSGNRMKAWEKN